MHSKNLQADFLCILKSCKQTLSDVVINFVVVNKVHLQINNHGSVVACCGTVLNRETPTQRNTETPPFFFF